MAKGQKKGHRACQTYRKIVRKHCRAETENVPLFQQECDQSFCRWISPASTSRVTPGVFTESENIVLHKVMRRPEHEIQPSQKYSPTRMISLKIPSSPNQRRPMSSIVSLPSVTYQDEEASLHNRPGKSRKFRLNYYEGRQRARSRVIYDSDAVYRRSHHP